MGVEIAGRVPADAREKAPELVARVGWLRRRLFHARWAEETEECENS
jgi:hypothetical protein